MCGWRRCYFSFESVVLIVINVTVVVGMMGFGMWHGVGNWVGDGGVR